MALDQIACVIATLPHLSPPVRIRTLARAERCERAAAAYDARGEDGHLGRRDWADDHRRPRARPASRPARRRRRRGRPPAKNDRRAGRRREQVSVLPRGLDPDRSVRHIHVLVPRIAAQDAPAWARRCSRARRLARLETNVGASACSSCPSGAPSRTCSPSMNRSSRTAGCGNTQCSNGRSPAMYSGGSTHTPISSRTSVPGFDSPCTVNPTTPRRMQQRPAIDSARGVRFLAAGHPTPPSVCPRPAA